MKKATCVRHAIDSWRMTWRGFSGISMRDLQVDIGQPTPYSRPDLLRGNEITPNITRQEYHKRRGILSESLPGPAGTVAIFFSAPQTFYGGYTAVPQPFRQRADIYYLSGIMQPKTAIILRKGNSPDETKFTIIVPPESYVDKLWEGSKINEQIAREYFSADEALTSDKLPQVKRIVLRDMVDEQNAKGLTIYVGGVPADKEILSILVRAQRREKIDTLVDSLRWRKSPSEIELIRMAAQWSAESALSGLQMAARSRLKRESEVRSWLEYTAMGGEEAMKTSKSLQNVERPQIDRRLLPQGLAYPPVVGAGPNSALIHALRSQGSFKDGNLLMIDFGVDIGGYSGDISRAGPVFNTTYSKPQAQLYRMIAEVHERLLGHCKPGITLSRIHQISEELLTEALLDLGVNMNSSSKSEIVKRKLYFPFYSHAVGHWLGIDVHDCPSVALNNPLVPGVVLTIEPGLYFQHDDTRVPAEFRGMGMRLEDDVLITPQGREILSRNVPYKLEEIEPLL